VLLSYLDVVVQGYAREFGAEGIDHFFDTTDGWSASILDDRENPIYPRHQTTTKSERDEVDGRLENLGVTRLSHADYLRW